MSKSAKSARSDTRENEDLIVGGRSLDLFRGVPGSLQRDSPSLSDRSDRLRQSRLNGYALGAARPSRSDAGGWHNKQVGQEKVLAVALSVGHRSRYPGLRARGACGLMAVFEP